MSHLACEQVLWQKFKHRTSKSNVIVKVTANFFLFSSVFFFFCYQIMKMEVEQFKQ